MSAQVAPHIQPELGKDQPVAKEQQGDNHDLGVINNWGYFILFSYFYISQGVLSGFISTMPFLYPQLPNESTMSIFNSSLLPFSFKFLIAPFLEQYSVISYGKRKTWFMISLIYVGTLIFVSSFFTEYRYDNLFAVIGILAQAGMAFLDIAAHASMIKELRSPAQASIILCFSQYVGNILGGFLLLKLTSLEFATSIGLSAAITTPRVFLVVYSISILVPAVIVHFYFKETTLESQKRGSRFTFCQTVSYYSVFLHTSSRYFRLCMYFLFYQQGFNFFTSLYDYNLVQAGFSRNTQNTIGNIIIFPVIIMTFYYSSWTNFIGGKARAVFLCIVLIILIDLYLLIVFPLQPWIIFVTSLLTNILNSWIFFIGAWMINLFPPHALTGMFITLNASFSNFGGLTTIHTILCSKFGWKLCSYIGLGIQAIIAMFIFRVFQWMEEGNFHVPPEIEQTQQQENHLQEVPQHQ